MAHLITSDDKFRDLAYDDGYRAYLITRRDEPGEYRFGRTQGKRVRVRVRSALRRVNGFLKNMIEGYRQFEAAAYGTLARAPRYSPGSGLQQLGQRAIPVRAAFATIDMGHSAFDPGSHLPVEDHMRQISFTASVLVLFCSGISALGTFLGPSGTRPDRRYHPEDH